MRKVISLLTSVTMIATMLAELPTYAADNTEKSEVTADMGEYIENDIDFNYKSIFEDDGIEKTVRDSVIGGERSSLFDDGWKFFKTQDMNADYSGVNGTVDDSKWANVTLPHDFQILQSGNMGSRYAMLKDYRGWYKKTFYLPEELSDKRISVRFDGIYQASQVYVNGKALPEYDNENPDASPYSGTHYYGYKTFEADLTDYLNFGEDKPNTITVSVKDQHSSSRWYTGAGINRNVWLTVSDKVHVAFNGTYVTYELNKDYTSANVKIKTELENESDEDSEVYIKQTLYNNGEVTDVSISAVSEHISAGESKEVEQSFTIDNPKLWGLGDDESGNLYTVRTELIKGADTEDTYDTYLTEFGMRDIAWDKTTGVYLNGEHIKLQGVCMHENLGSLGSASNAAAIERQMVILKRMGVNAIRTAHNICTPELMTICNRLGLLVLEEAFDSWDDTKDGNYSPGGQGLFLDSYESDIRLMVRRDRNNPCVFMWSIGNEIIQTVWGSMSESWPKIKNMLDYIMDEDPDGGRYITLAQMQWTTDYSQQISAKICDYLAENYKDCGVMGENYREYYMDQAHENYPGYRMLGTENSSAVRSRGVYHEGSYVFSHEDLQVSSLDNAGPAYYLPADYMYMFDMNRDWYGGEFIWSGFDYIGEPSPYDTKNAYFGIVDTAGLPKDIYYFYKSVWNKNENTVHILPYWDKNDGDNADVIVYSDAETVDLYYEPYEGSDYEPVHLTKTVDWKDKYEETWGISNKPEYSDRLRFDFNLTYHPGTIYAVAKYSDGHKVYTKLATPNDAANIKLRADRTTIAADGRDMSFVEINAVDSDGNLIALDSDRVKIEVSGAAELVSTDSGNPVDYDTYQSETRKLFNGKAVAYIRSNGSVGDIKVKATALNMEAAEITLRANEVEALSGYEINKSETKADSTLDKSLSLGSTIYARKLEITPAEGSPKTLTAQNPTMTLNYKLLPENLPNGTKLTGGDLNFRVIGTDGYVRVNNAAIEVDKENRTITVTGLKPGEFRIYGTYTNGEKQIQLLSTYTIVNESAESDDPSLINDAYAGINATKLDPSSNNQSYTVDYDKNVVTGIYRANDTLVYKDVEFGSDYSRELVLNCYNSGSAGSLEVYVDDELKTTIALAAKESAVYTKHSYPLSGITGTHDITFRNVVQGTSLCIESFRFTGSGTDPYNAYERIEGESFDYYTASDNVPTATEYTDSNGTTQGTLSIMDNCGVYYKGVDFGEEGSDTFEICMKRVQGSGNIAITVGDSEEFNPDWESMASYKAGEYTVYRVKLGKTFTGVKDVELFAYPGAVTEIDWFKFVNPRGMLLNSTVFNKSDGYGAYGTATLSYGKKTLSAALGSGKNGIMLDVTELIKSNPSGTELLASAAFTTSSAAETELFLENQNGDRVIIASISNKSAANETTALSGKISYSYNDGDTIYLCLTTDSGQLNVSKLTLAYNAGGDNYAIPGTVTKSGDIRLAQTTAKYSITADGTFSRDAAVSVKLDGEEAARLTYDPGEKKLIGETSGDITEGVYEVTYELVSGTADISEISFELSQQFVRVDLIDHSFDDDGDKDGYVTYTEGDGTIGGTGNITVSNFASGWNEYNGIKLDITDMVSGKSSSRFGGSADVYTTASGEVKMFIETVSPSGDKTMYKLDSISDGPGDVSLTGAADDVVFSDDDKVYLCITQWSGYTSFDNIKLWYYQEIKKDTKTELFKHTFNADKTAQVAMYEPYETSGTIGGSYAPVLKCANANGDVTGIRLNLTEKMGLKAELSGLTFGASTEVQSNGYWKTMELFFEVVSKDGSVRTVPIADVSSSTAETGELLDSETAASLGKAWLTEPLQGETELSFTADDTVYLCMTTTSDAMWLDDITVYYTGEPDTSTVKPTEEPSTSAKTELIKHTFNADKTAQVAMYEPYETSGTIGGSYAPVLKCANANGDVTGIRLNLTDKLGLAEELSGLTFGVSTEVQSNGYWKTMELFFEVVSKDGSVRTVPIADVSSSTAETGELLDSETGANLGKAWLTEPLQGETELSFTADDTVYLCMTTTSDAMWLDDLTIYYIAETPTAAPTEQPTAVPTEQPTAVPTDKPTAVPTDKPTAVPTDKPTAVPTELPTGNEQPVKVDNFDSEKCSGTVTLNNNVDSGVVIIAAYDNTSHICEGVKIVPYDEIRDNKISFEFNKKNAYVKVFVWDSVSGMKPLFDSVTAG